MAEGDGPVNALDAALRSGARPLLPQLERCAAVDYKVRIIDSTSGTAAKTRVLIESSDGDDRMGHGRRPLQHHRGEPAGARGQSRIRAGKKSGAARLTGCTRQLKLVQSSVASLVSRSRAVTLLKLAILAVVLLVALPYAWGPIYRFPAPSVFTGAHFLNPYASLVGTWQRANLHAHGRAWSGLTNGQQSDEDVVKRYQSLGYSVAGISDYERIAALHGVPTIPLYEHGYNVGKHHQLAIGAHSVEWFDFLLWQSLSHEQYVIDRVAKTADLVAIAHPSLRDAYSLDDLQQLTGYDLMEVVNSSSNVDDVWDAALSTGHMVWGLANDDTHDINDRRRTAVAWNMINAPTPSTSDVVDALRAGRTYAVSRVKRADSLPPMETVVTNVGMTDSRLLVTCDGVPSTFVFVGQNGEIRKTVKNVVSADYTFDPDDTYIRTVIRSPRTTMYLNPVLRYDGVHVPRPVSTVDAVATWTLRGSCLLASAVMVFALRQRRRLVPSLAAERLLTTVKRKTA